MSRAVLLVVAWGLPLALCGCGSDVSGGIAVVDLDEVARELGRDAKFKQALQSKETEFNIRLAALERSMGAPYGYSSRGNVRMDDARADARKELASFKQSLIADFRKEVAPIAQEIAAERGLSIVVPKNDNLLLAFEEGVNITGPVTERLKQAATEAAERVADAETGTSRQ